MWNQTDLERGQSRSVIRELFAYGQKLKAERGEDAVCDFSLGNPATPPPEAVLDAFRRLCTSADPTSLHVYTSAEGDPGVRARIAEVLTARTGVPHTAGELFLTAGAAPALCTVVHALTEAPGDEFIALAPYFPEYAVFSSVAGGTLRVCPARRDLTPDIEALPRLISPRTRAVFLNSPNNPSGVVYDRACLSDIAACLTERSREIGHPVYLISDEPYRELVYGGAEVPYVPALYPHTVVCYSYSKSLSLPGDRIGYILVPASCPDARALLTAVAGAARTLGHVCAPSLLQRVVGEAADALPNLAFYDRNRRVLYEGLISIGYTCVPPRGAFYLLLRAPGGDAAAFSDVAKTREGLLLVPCDAFGLPGYLRLAYCVSPAVIERALPRFRRLAERFL